MEVKIEEEKHRGRAYVQLSDTEFAEMTYNYARNSKMIIEHTEVHDDLRGEGIGKEMLKEIVKIARQKGLRIIPICPFAKAQFQKDPSIRDVVA